MNGATTDPIEVRLEAWFADNLRAMELDGNPPLAPETKRTALWQVKLYWRKLRAIAEKVTDTEVKLNLPGQKSPAGRSFGIEGVVDIVRENDQVVMYDIKTHDPAVIRANPESYRRQLNVYTHIWQHLRGERLDATAIICTAYPESWRNLLDDETRLADALGTWEPVIDLAFSDADVQATLQEFGTVVDRIETGDFGPPPTAQLLAEVPGSGDTFARHYCRNCDARFSCAAYRGYALSTSGGGAERVFRQYYGDIGPEAEREDWADAGLATAPPVTAWEAFVD